MAQSETILSEQTHPGDSSIQSVTGNNYKGDGYYGRSDGFHTVQYKLTNFMGVVKVQATLAVNPTDDDFFDVVFDEHLTASTESKIANFSGNYVWIRAVLTNWTSGTSNSIRLNH